MSQPILERRIAQLLAQAGIRLNGSAPYEPQIHDPQFYQRVVTHGSLGLGETYMDKAWDTRDLYGFLFRLLAAHVDETARGLDDAWLWIKAKLLNLQRGRRA